jgi:ketosteroid isomerase-like protein
MSRENVEIVQRAIDAFNTRDLDAALRDVDPKVELDWSRSRGVRAAIYRGHEAFRTFWTDFSDTFERITITPDEFIEFGDHVVVPNRGLASGRDGIEVPARSALVVTLRDRRIVRWCLYQDRIEALKAVGLAE